MTFRDRVGLFGFVLVVVGAAMTLSVTMDFVTRSFNIRDDGPVYAMVAAALCGLPIACFVGTRLILLRRLKDQLEITSRHDSLTGLLNRPTFLARLAEHPPRKGAVALLDVDHFKSINDSHGHFIGDEVLSHIGRILERSCRPGDLVCRFGGEEFAILFADATPERASVLAEALVRTIAFEEIVTGATRHALTVSLGYAMRDSGTDPAKALLAADEALYRAKAQGRNRAVAAWTPPTRIAA